MLCPEQVHISRHCCENAMSWNDPMVYPPELSTRSLSTTVAKVTYASPAWWGHTSAAERNRIEGFLSWMKRMDYLSDDLGGAAQLVESAEDELMCSIIAQETHVLHPFCPPMNWCLGMIPTISLRLCLDGSDLIPDLHVRYPLYNNYLMLWGCWTIITGIIILAMLIIIWCNYLYMFCNGLWCDNPVSASSKMHYQKSIDIIL